MSPIDSFDQLEATFHAGSKPREQWKVGVEFEKAVVSAATGESVPYQGPAGIAALLGSLADSPRWQPVYEDDNVIALLGDGASITLEPGGQLELSGRLWSSLGEADKEIQEHLDESISAAEGLGLRLLGLGAVPKTPIGQMPWMPKQRYRIMRTVMENSGRLGHRMMQQTATVQSNFDYSDETDARKKFRLAMAMAPVLFAVSANSPIIDGRASGYRSFRAHIWNQTDTDRCGVLEFAFNTENIFGRYADYALDVPMYFISRDNLLLATGGLSFRSFMAKGFDGHHATLEDWSLHLSTLFPEARLKTWLEVRSADNQPAELLLATPALMKGLLYESDCLDAAWDIVGRWSFAQRLEAAEGAARSALQARVDGHALAEYARELCEIAREGLRRQAAGDGDEGRYLDPLLELVEAGRCPADEILDQWQGPWRESPDKLIQYAAYQ